jgi:hypothetical protein
MNKFIPLSDVYSGLNRYSAKPATPKPFISLQETYAPSAPVLNKRLHVYNEDVDITARDTASSEYGEYTVEKEWWDNVITHYLAMQKKNPTIGSDIKKLFDLCVDKKVIKTSQTDKYISQLDYLTNIMDYIYDIADDAGEMLMKMKSDAVANAFISFLNSNINKKVYIFDWLKNVYGDDFTKTKESVMVNIWQMMRPVVPGQTRGQAGPAEVPIMLFCGGKKAAVGDIDIKDKNLELKANGGRIGSFTPWIQNKKVVDAFINGFQGEPPKQQKKAASIEQQVRNQMNEIEDTVVDSPDTAALRAVGAQGSFATVPDDVIASAKLCIEQGIVTNKQQAIAFIGICQLIDYAVDQNFNWIGIIKHNSAYPKIPKMGAMFIMSRSELISTATGLYAPDKIYKIMQTMVSNNMSFERHNDEHGYSITFKAERN